MKFALVAQKPFAMWLAGAICSHPEHTLSHAVTFNDSAAELIELVPSIRVVANWDELIADSEIDAVIVDGRDQQILDAAKQLAHAGKSLLVLPRAALVSPWIYELTLIRDAAGASLFPVLPRRSLPEVVQLRELLQKEVLGPLRYLQLDRERNVRPRDQSPPMLSISLVDEEMLSDVDLLRSLGGEFSRVTALYSGRTGDSVSTASVTLAGEGPPEAIWTLKPTTAEATWKLTVTGEKGVLRLVGSRSGRLTGGLTSRAADSRSPSAIQAAAGRLTGGSTSLEAEGIELPAQAVQPAKDTAATILEQFEAMRSGRLVRPDWDDLTRAFEIVEAAHESIRRRRTIDLHFETTSERGVFKSQMTVLGCGVLLLTLAGMLGLLLIGPLFDVRDSTQAAAERADAVIHRDAFLPGTARLTEETEKHVADVVESMSPQQFPVLVEESADGSQPELDEQRRQTVVRLLEEQGVADADQRTSVAPLEGKRWTLAMRIARIVVFLPLFLFLGLQLLLFLARPSRSSSTSIESAATAD